MSDATVDLPAGDAGQVSASRVRQGRLLAVCEAYALLILIVATGVFFALFPATRGTFLTAANLRILVSNQVVPAIVALAALIPLVCDELDLSLGANVGLTAIFVAGMLTDGTAVPLALACGVLIGAAVGLVNALLVTRAAVNGVITTLGISTLIAGAVQQKTGGLPINGNLPATFSDFGGGNVAGIPETAVALAIIALCVYFLLEHTPYGRHLYAMGSNRSAARLVGLRIQLLIGSSFVIAGMLAAIAGLIYVAQDGGADPSVGPSYTLAGLAAAFLSAAAVHPGRFSVAGTIVAVFFLAVFNNGLSLAGAAPYVASYVNGGALIIGVALAMYISRRRGR